MEARARRISPGTMTMVESQDDPSISGSIFACREGGLKNLVVVGLFVEADESFQHGTHLYVQAG